MRLTRRGRLAIVLAGLAIALAAMFGPRALNAVAAPLLGAVAVGAVQVWWAEEPTVELSAVAPGFPGTERTWTVEIDGGGVLDVTHEWPDGLDGDPIDAVLALPETIETDLELSERGVYEVPAPTLRRRDALGMVRASIEPAERTTIVVYPAVYRGASRGSLGELFTDQAHAERQEFDRLREYTPGDPLRHVHWKSSAKHDEFLVTEFNPSSRTESVMVAAQCTPGCADEMATAAGTMALMALRAGLSVGLHLPGERVPPGSGENHAANLLAALARADYGELADEPDDADVLVEARPRETLVRIGDGTLLFSELVDEPTARPAREVTAA